ncbi:MAG: 7-cyano-7-deazaguanine synthase [Planctomycetales bacterium]|nr:7-cyano-7-deazaguanine synthase [Planctomycetales bacterium]
MGSASKKAVVLLSGGLDSTTTLAIAQSEGFEPYAMTFRYGQRHSVELDAARRIAEKMQVAKHIVVDIDLAMFGPARNTIFLSFALAWAEVLGAADIVLGVNAVDYSGYPDCRPEYIAAYEQMANLATKAGVEGAQRLKIHTPLITLTKAQIIRRGLDLGVDYSLTTTCYDPEETTGKPCGRCDACQLRIKGFQENGMEDPALLSKS